MCNAHAPHCYLSPIPVYNIFPHYLMKGTILGEKTTLLHWKSNTYYIFWVCVCSLTYTARNAHAPYCYLWPIQLYNIFPHYLMMGTILGEKKTLLHWKINTYYIFWVSVCSLTYTARNAHAPHCYLSPIPVYNIFPHYLMMGTIWGGGGIHWTQNVCFDFLYNFCLKHFSF
jgi:hypothetical protein